MIVDLTVDDNDFTHIFREYFEKYTYKYRLDFNKENIDEYIRIHKEYKEVEEKLQEDRKKALKDVNFIDKAIKVLREDIKAYLIDNYDEDVVGYLMKHLKIKLGDTYTIKWQNGEHIYTNFGNETQQFIVIQ